jgi:hypothetical protein
METLRLDIRNKSVLYSENVNGAGTKTCLTLFVHVSVFATAMKIAWRKIRGSTCLHAVRRSMKS